MVDLCGYLKGQRDELERVTEHLKDIWNRTHPEGQKFKDMAGPLKEMLRNYSKEEHMAADQVQVQSGGLQTKEGEVREASESKSGVEAESKAEVSDSKVNVKAEAIDRE